MPALPQRRKRKSLSVDEENLREDGSQTPVSAGNKRARIDDAFASSSMNNGVLPDDYLADPRTGTDLNGVGQNVQKYKHQPGSIVRVKLNDFVTYTSAEFLPGPSLNMVIGPNGTGKSTLVCAICLGLGWGPVHLGRAKEVGEFVKHGCAEATIEVELAADPSKQRRNPVIKRLIKRENNKSLFFINGKQCTKSEVTAITAAFSIQIDNLCQFLPQDKVCEFAALTPVELLHSTQRAAAPPDMLEWHQTLKQLRGDQKRLLLQHSNDKDALANLEGRQNMQRADVDRLRERAEIVQRLKMLEKVRPFARYREARLKVKAAKEKRRHAQSALEQLESELEPSLQAVNHKQSYRANVELVVKDRRRGVESADASAESLLAKQRNLLEKVNELRTEAQAETNSFKSRKQEIPKIDANITRIKKMLEDKPVELDAASYNEQIREKSRLLRDIQVRAGELKQKQMDLVSQGRERNEKIARAERDLQNLDSQAGQQGNKLRQISRETHSAWEWVQANQDQFEKHVYGPPVVECSVKDPKYVDAIESLLQKNDFLAFTCQTRADFKRLQQQLYGSMKLADINIRTYTEDLLGKFRPPVSTEERQRLGFEGWAFDYLSGPGPVLAMLCGECRLHQTGIALRDIDDEQYAVIERSPVSSWVTGRFSYQITRRREYGPGAVSTRVRDLKRAQVWTNQPVDTGAKRELQETINTCTEEVLEINREIEEAKGEVAELREQHEVIEQEKKGLESEKSAKQKAIADYKALPTKLSQQEEKREAIRKEGSEVKQRCLAINSKIEELTLERAQVAIDYARSVEALRTGHRELYKLEIMLIEATSEVEQLSERNRSVRDMLNERRREYDVAVEKVEGESRVARHLLEQCKATIEEGGAAIQQFVNDLPDGQMPDDLEADIDSTKARLELVHEGDPDTIRQFEERQKKIERLHERLSEHESRLETLTREISDVREKWEPRLDELVKHISDAFAYSFEKIGCAGQVGVHKDEDFDQWAIEIQVKFREHESLAILDNHRQSGGERAVSTIFYLMALQSLARAPFRVVDEINQGMDPRNERMVHERMVDIACAENTAQYFLITPKLLHDLKYHPRMKVLCIASGEYMPSNYHELDFKSCLSQMRAIKAGV